MFLPCLLTCCSVKGTKSLKWFQSFCPFSSIVSLHGSGLDNISNLASTAAVPCWVDSGKCTFENTNSSSMQESLIGWRRVMSWAKETGKCSTWKAPNERVGKPQMRGGESPNERRGEKQLHRRTQWTYARFVTEKVRVHVLTIPIMCPFLHFQSNFLPQSAMEVQFPGYRHFVLPTHNTVSWGTWLADWHRGRRF